MGIKQQKKSKNKMPDNLFDKISIESATFRVEDFDHYTAMVKAAEAFSKCILNKSKKTVVDLINKTIGKKFRVSDFTGNVKIGLSRFCEKEIVFLVNFELSTEAKNRQGFLGWVQFYLTAEANKKDTAHQKNLSVSKKKSLGHVDLQQIWDFKFQGIKYSTQIKSTHPD